MSILESKEFKLKNNQKLIICSATLDDAEAIIRLAKEDAEEAIYSLKDSDEIITDLEKQKEWIQKHIDAENNILLAAKIDNKTVGFCGFETAEFKRIAHTGEFGIFVSNDARGLGVGEFLLRTLVTWAEKSQILEKIDLTVHANNTRAICLYKKLGFAQEGLKIREIKYPDGKYVDTLLMSKFV